MVQDTRPCWLPNDDPYAQAYNNRGEKCTKFGLSDLKVAIPVFCVLIFILLVLGVGWIVRYSRQAKRFSRFWNQSPEDYELKTHQQQLLYDDGASVHTGQMSLAPPSTIGKHGRSPLGSSTGDEDPIDIRDHEYASTGYGDGGLGQRGGFPRGPADFPSSGSNQFYPGVPAAPWQAFPGASGSHVNLHAGPPSGGGERSAFLAYDPASSAQPGQATFGSGPPPLPDMERFDQPGPRQNRYADPYSNRI